MGLLRSLFKKDKNKETTKDNSQKGILLFENTSEVIKAENLLKEQGYEIKVVGPPAEVRKGCDLAIEFPSIYLMGILETLKANNLEPVDWLVSKGENLKPVDIFHLKDFGDFLMVRAANMKITIDKNSNTIVNVSGGGCPDVPYLAQKLVGKKLDQAQQPRLIGHTLCGYALQLAFDKLKELCSQ